MRKSKLHSLEALSGEKNLENVSLQCKFSDFFCKHVFATFCEIKKLKGIFKNLL